MAATPLLRNSWKLGWRPDQDLETGNPEGPLRMQNVTLEEDNCLSLAHGMETVQSGYSGFVHTLYSKFIGPVRYDFAGTSSGDIYVSGTASPLVTGGSTSIAAFDTGLGFVYLLTGTQRKKYSPDISVPSNIAFSPLGISRPLATDYAIASYSVYNYIETTGLQPIMEVGGTYTISGVSIASNFNLPSTGGVAWGTPYDMENLYGTTDGISFVLGEASDPGNDLFTMQVKVDTASSVASISVSFYGEDFNTNDAATKFTHTWVVDGINVALFDDSFVTLKARRRDFTTDGPANITWNNIYGVFIGGAMTDPTAYIMGDVPAPNIEYKNLRWQGGLYGQLSGYYEYAIQAVSTNPFYVAKSPLSPTTKVRVFQGTVTVNTAALAVSDAQITEIWIYRRSVPDDSANVDAQELGYFLTQFYKVGSIPYNVGPIVPFSDTTSDRDALVLNIVGNQFLQSVSDLNATGELYGTVETANGRRLYMTYQYLYVSDILNPDAIDSRFTLKASDLLAEKNLFVTRQPDGSILLGTTKDFYRITGTFVEMQDNVLDVVIQALGEEHPPICHQFANDGGSIIYTGNDGVRITSGGGESQLLSVGLKQLYEGESRYQLAPVAFLPNDNAYYPVASAHGKIFAIVPLMDGSRTGFVYDLVRKYWFQYDTDPFCLEVTEDGYILGGYNNNESSIQRLWNPLANTKFDGSGQYVDVWIAFDDNGQPRNRKDTWTFKMIADTGGVDVNILIAKDGSNTYYNIGPISFNGKTERLITIANTIALGKKFSIRFTGQFSTFKLYHYCIEYDPRPEQLTFIRIPYNNLGTQTRKRFVNYAFVIDTLGTTCEFFPFVDGATAGPSSTFVMDRKGTYIHFFNENEEGIDIGGIICGFFEFYGINLEETFSEKMPTAATRWRIVQEDYGVPNRKRHSSYKFVINTRGNPVRFTPRIDETDYPTLDFTTSEKQTVEYFFPNDTIGIDIGGLLDSLNDQPFEFYGIIRPQQIEVMPPRLEEFRIPENNYGVAAKKRIRTMPMVINTNGHDVEFTPVVDNVYLTPSIHNTPNKQTVFHYFTTDIFGIDYSGELKGASPFEFYGLEKPESVEVIPVGKKFDQVGPFELSRLGKLLFFRFRAICTGIDMPYQVYFQDGSQLTGNFTTIPNIDKTYEVIVPKSKQGQVFRVEFGPTDVFHRYYVECKFVMAGKLGSPGQPIWLTLPEQQQGVSA